MKDQRKYNIFQALNEQLEEDNCLYFSQKAQTEPPIIESSKQKFNNSKKSLFQITPRITRRMKRLMDRNEKCKTDTCAICLNNYECGFALLECKHSFCLECVIKWWRNNQNCPFCRERIGFITTSNGKRMYRSDLPKQEIDKNKKFIPNCQLCWASIDQNEEMRTCTICRHVYWHVRCLPYKSRQWYCMECDEQQSKELEID